MKICAKCGKGFTCRGGRFCSMECSGSPSRNKRHGYSGTKIHATWLDMRNRCRNPKFHNYARYGGRGIKVCERWNVFENFLADMGDHPGGEYTIERIDNDGNYEPSNCKWGTKLEQGRNRKCVHPPAVNAKILELVSLGKKPRHIAAEMGIPTSVLYSKMWRLRRSAKHPSTMRAKNE